MLTDKHFFSIVVPAYNEEKYLSSCLKALKAQAYPKNRYEIIVVDNGSTDKTISTANKYKVKVITEPQKGVAYARDTGARVSKGEIIATTDADTIVPTHWLLKLNNCFDSPKIAAVAGNVVVAKSTLINRFINRFYIPFFSQLNRLMVRLINRPFDIYSSNFAFRKSAFEAINGYHDKNHIFSDQIDFIRRLSHVGRVEFNPNIVVETSDRRHKKRFLKFYLSEIIWQNYIGYLMFKLTGKAFDRWKDVR